MMLKNEFYIIICLLVLIYALTEYHAFVFVCGALVISKAAYELYMRFSFYEEEEDEDDETDNE